MKKVLTKILIAIWILLLVLMGGVAYLFANPDKAAALGYKLSGQDPPGTVSEDSAEDDNKDAGEVPVYDFSGGLDKNLDISYVSPERSDVRAPENVVEKTGGYDPVVGTDRKVSKEDAQNIGIELTEGYTGDELDFDPEFYPYYDMLGDKGKHLYRQLYANSVSLNACFKPVEQDLGTAGFKNVFASLVGDHPELFWLNTSYECLYDPYGRCVEVKLSFNRTAQDPEASKAEFNENANEILDKAKDLGSDFEKEKYVHQALIDRIDYNRNAEMDQSAYSALVNDSTVCAGYSRAMQYLLQQLGIPCYYCTGYAGENHAWNIVKLDDEYYNVDTTWDDTEGGEYDYFNKSDSDYGNTHVRTELAVYLPPCRGEYYSDPNAEEEEYEEYEDEDEEYEDDEEGDGNGQDSNEITPSDENTLYTYYVIL